MQGVLDRQRVQSELVRDQPQLIDLGCHQVDPDHGARFLEVLGELVDVEVGVGEDTVLVAAGAGHTATVTGDAHRLAHDGGEFVLRPPRGLASPECADVRSGSTSPAADQRKGSVSVSVRSGSASMMWTAAFRADVPQPLMPKSRPPGPTRCPRASLVGAMSRPLRRSATSWSLGKS